MMKFYKCDVCGKIVAMVRSRPSETFCCGQPMRVLAPNMTEGAKEKHIPVHRLECNGLTVQVGETPHPMTTQHQIEWIAIETENGNQRKVLKPDDEPKAKFPLLCNDKVRNIFAYCNLHGLWKAKLALLAAFLALGGCSSVRPTSDIPAVGNFDAVRYMGTWHEIARLPKWFERGLDDVTAEYSLDGEDLHIVNRGFRDGEEHISTALGKFAGEKDVGEFRVSFFRPFYGDYRIIWLSSEYDMAIVTSSDRSSLWILSREKNISPNVREAMVKRAEKWGFDVGALEYAR